MSDSGLPESLAPVYSNLERLLGEVEKALSSGMQAACLGGNVQRVCNLANVSESTVYRACDMKDWPSLRLLIIMLYAALNDPTRTPEQALAPLLNLCRVFGVIARPVQHIGQGSPQRATASMLRCTAAVLVAMADEDPEEAIEALRDVAACADDARADYERTDDGKRDHLIRIATVRETAS